MEEQLRDVIGEYRSGRIARGDFVKWAALLGLGTPFLGSQVARAARGAAPTTGGTIRVGAGVPVSIEPPQLVDGEGVGIAQQAGDYLVSVGPDLIVRPSLATSWKPSQGFKVWTFALRKGVTFHSGKALTADDVVATFKRLVDPKGTSTAQGGLSFLTPAGVAKIDDYTVQFTLMRPVVDFPYYLYSTYQAIILPTTYKGDYARTGDGTGPFKLVEYVPGQRARFVRNPNYWNKPRPYVDGVEFVLGGSADSQLTQLLGGSVDTVIVTDYTHLQILTGNPQYRISQVNSSGHNGIFVRTDRAPFSDVRVRQALAFALDRPAIIQTTSHGLAVQGDDNIVAPVFPEYTPLPQRAKNIAKAKALLAAAGHPRGFSTAVLTNGSSPGFVQLAVAVQQQAQAIGIDVSIKTDPGSVYYNTDWLTAPFTITDWAHRPSVSYFINVAYKTGAPWNASHWSNKQFDSLANKLDGTLDLSQRKTIAHQLELVQTDQTPAFLTYFSKIARPIRATLQGVHADPGNYLDLSQGYFTK
ncbi:MAG TPA: ABC transporter substrate-binding protein [Chloroflexota bacterium]|nr:ABC transporter substrate-binding protein [Chloroflexota bacterium]